MEAKGKDFPGPGSPRAFKADDENMGVWIIVHISSFRSPLNILDNIKKTLSETS